MARVREPAPSAVEQTAKRTTMTAVHIQPVQEQVEVQQSYIYIYNTLSLAILYKEPMHALAKK